MRQLNLRKLTRIYVRVPIESGIETSQIFVHIDEIKGIPRDEKLCMFFLSR